MIISSLHYITQETADSHEENAKLACMAGVDWVQLRVKDKSLLDVEAIAKGVRHICDQYGATFIVNDYVDIAMAVDADGVHLGKEDMTPEEARADLGGSKIIGGTANTFEDIQRLTAMGVDYIGLGPFRFTSTKEKLSPILGLEGYREIKNQCQDHGIVTPIVAIGGITESDVRSIRLTGVHGVAVASLINLANNRKEKVERLKNELING